MNAATMATGFRDEVFVFVYFVLFVFVLFYFVYQPISLLCLEDTTMQTPFPEQGLSKTENYSPDELLICHFHSQLDSSSWISQTPGTPRCKQDKTLQMAV